MALMLLGLSLRLHPAFTALWLCFSSLFSVLVYVIKRLFAAHFKFQCKVQLHKTSVCAQFISIPSKLLRQFNKISFHISIIFYVVGLFALGLYSVLQRWVFFPVLLAYSDDPDSFPLPLSKISIFLCFQSLQLCSLIKLTNLYTFSQFRLSQFLLRLSI